MALAVLLLAGGCAEEEGDEDARGTTTTEGERERRSTTTSTAAPAGDPEVEAAVEELSAYVEDVRERRFLRPVAVELLADEAFVARLREDAEEDEEELAGTAGTLRALGLLEADDDLRAALEAALGAGVIGFYDPETDELVLRGAALTPKVRSTLVHELVHALDDQHFELERPALDDADDESGFGFTALVEGNAVRVEDGWVEALPDEEREQLEEEQRADGERVAGIDVPEVVLQLIGLPYAVGPDLVEALLDEGGEGRVDEAFGDPPTTSEQVLDPQAFLAGGEPPVPVDEPPADGPVADRGVIGQAGVLLTLLEPVGVSTAQEAGRGWGGDRYVTWEADGGTCVRMAFAADSSADLAELAEAWGEWAEDRPSGRVDATGDRVTVTACSEG